MMKRIRIAATFTAFGAMVASAAAGSATITVSRPTGNGVVTVTVTRRDGTTDRIPISVTRVMTVEEKRNQIAVNLLGRGYSASASGSNGVSVDGLDEGTVVAVDMGATGEVADRVAGSNARTAQISFDSIFDPIDANGLPAVFTAGLVTANRSALVQVTAEELGFDTAGANVATALFERLLPQAASLAVTMDLTDLGIEVGLPPSSRFGRAGVIFGTTSLSEGCHASAIVGHAAGAEPGDAAPEALFLTATHALPVRSEIEVASATTANYCVYMIVSSSCNDRLAAGDFVCLNCNASEEIPCSNTIAYAIVNGSDVECTGRWSNANGSDTHCQTCPAHGKTGWKFK